jgi:hypothetical protein
MAAAHASRATSAVVTSKIHHREEFSVLIRSRIVEGRSTVTHDSAFVTELIT